MSSPLTCFRCDTSIAHSSCNSHLDANCPPPAGSTSGLECVNWLQQHGGLTDSASIEPLRTLVDELTAALPADSKQPTRPAKAAVGQVSGCCGFPVSSIARINGNTKLGLLSRAGGVCRHPACRPARARAPLKERVPMIPAEAARMSTPAATKRRPQKRMALRMLRSRVRLRPIIKVTCTLGRAPQVASTLVALAAAQNRHSFRCRVQS